ncbi:MAG TPA: cation diffusion facilitator family transporter [Bacteroidia bacterium]|nr:cation diffusion facilitator family transporter [Bacteroidia bacterium]
MSKKPHNKSSHIIQSLVVNLLIAISKSVAAFMTHSGAMLAEAIHSFSDCANQILLLVGVRQSQKAATARHPLGQGRAIYFWSFMVAMLLFSIGGMFSIYEGIHKFNMPEPIQHVSWGIGILFFSLLLESYAMYSNIVEMNVRRGKLSFMKYLRATKDSDLVVVFGENSAAVFGLIVALVAMLASYYTGDSRYDAAGSFCIGVILICVAIFLSVEVKSLLIGESASDEILQSVNDILQKHAEVIKLINCITIQQGPGEVMMCMKIKCAHNFTALELSKLINKLEHEIRSGSPEVKWLYVEPDAQEWKEK